MASSTEPGLATDHGSKLDEDRIRRFVGLPIHPEFKNLAPLKHIHEIGTPNASDVTPIPRQEEPAIGAHDVENIVYLSLIPDIPEAREQLRKFQDANEITSVFLSVKASEAADLQIERKNLPTDDSKESRVKRSNYRAAIIDYAIQRLNWVYLSATQGIDKEFDVYKADFHKVLLDAILAGLNVPPVAYKEFEKVLTGILHSVETFKSVKERQYKWISLFTYEWDKTQKRVFAGIRTIHFEVSESLQQYSSNKKTVTVVQLTLYYKQDDYRISEPLWDKAKADVEKAISKNDGIFDGPIELPV